MTSGNTSIDFNNTKRDNHLVENDLQNLIDINVNKATEDEFSGVEFQQAMGQNL